MVGTGVPLESELRRSLRHFGETHKDLFWMRWPDFKDFRHITTQYVAPKAPADFIALYEGKFYALECKSTKSPRYLMSWFRDHQREYLLQIKRAGGFSYMIFSHRSKKRSEVRCWAIDISDYLYLEASFEAEGRASIPVGELAGKGIELPRVSIVLEGTDTKQSAWDLTPLFEHDALKRWSRS